MNIGMKCGLGWSSRNRFPPRSVVLERERPAPFLWAVSCAFRAFVQQEGLQLPSARDASHRGPL